MSEVPKMHNSSSELYGLRKYTRMYLSWAKQRVANKDEYRYVIYSRIRRYAITVQDPEVRKVLLNMANKVKPKGIVSAIEGVAYHE